ncbi:MAG: metallophosphoesterase family protein [Clostridia bacterium]|nr:metallophosphoesterase family protein [Clostridia bacterium]
MKILVLSDTEDPFLWDYYVPGRLNEYDLILSAGDLKAEYLRFLVTMTRVPVLFVHGNHDTAYDIDPPEGCDCIEDTVINYRGIRILGLGGCVRYRPAKHQYTERQMARRIRKVQHKIKKAGGVDIVLTHAAPKGCEDISDHAHQGFACFLPLIEQWKPQYLVHGHVHLNYGAERLHRIGSTRVINAFQKYVIEIEPQESDKGNEQKRWFFQKRKNV